MRFSIFAHAGALLSLALPLAIFQACGSSESPAVPASDAGVDADASAHPQHDASVDSGDDDAGDASLVDASSANKDAATDVDAGHVLGGDAGPIGDAGACALVPGPHPVQNFSVSNVVVSGDATQTITVPDGFVVSGTIAAPIPDDHPLAKGSSYFSLFLYDPATGASYGWSSGTSSSYSLSVPAGRYYAQYDVRYDLWDDGSAEPTNSVVLLGVDIVDVCGDAVHDVTLRSLPALAPAKITVAGIDRLHLSGFGNDLGLTSADGTFIWQGPAGDGTSATVVVPTLLPLNETLSVLMNGEILPDVVAASTMTVTLPTQVNVTGSLTMETGEKGAVQCEVPTQNPLNARAWPGDSERFANAVPASGPVLEYTLPVRAGAACNLTASIASTTGIAGLLLNAFTSVPVPVSALADATHDFTVPAFDPPVSVTVNVVDARGAPLTATQAVAAKSSELAGASAGWTAAGSAAPKSGTAIVAVPPATYTFTILN